MTRSFTQTVKIPPSMAKQLEEVCRAAVIEYAAKLLPPNAEVSVELLTKTYQFKVTAQGDSS